MKHTKKALALFMALVMSLSLLTATAFATDTGTITVENTTNGKSYSIYKVFDATYSAADAASYTIKTTDAWYDLVKNNADSPFQLSTEAVGTTTDTYTVTLKSGKTSDDVLTWFNGLKAAGSTVTMPSATATQTGNGGALTFSNLTNGYYYVTSELGSLITLTNLNNSAEIVDKNQAASSFLATMVKHMPPLTLLPSATRCTIKL